MTIKPVYYSEWDGFCADWLCNLMEASLLPPGDVDRRSIRDVKPEDLKGYHQCHFFAGIGGWPLALQLAGWPDDRPVWTGSCPCQPFSAAGKRRGSADDRHLWPELLRLIGARQPATVFGEQVASKDGRLWLAGVRSNLEALAYEFGGADLCAAGIGAAHIRQRLWWVADADGERRSIEGVHLRPGGQDQAEIIKSGTSRMADPDGGRACHGNLQRSGEHGLLEEDRFAGGLALASPQRRGALQRPDSENGGPAVELDGHSIPCLDGKTRRVEPGTFPLAHGVPARVGQLRAYGNAIVPQVAAEFVAAFTECEP